LSGNQLKFFGKTFKKRNDEWEIFSGLVIDIDHWQSNCPDLNALDYCIWDELIKVVHWNIAISQKKDNQTVKTCV